MTDQLAVTPEPRLVMTPNGWIGGRRATPEERLEAFSRATPDGCVVWDGVRTAYGYGQLSVGGKRLFAHRLAYTSARGPIPSGLQIDHLCRNRACVNPDHLEAVTQAENIKRGVGPTAENARKTHCAAGHFLGGDNLDSHSLGEDRRKCRACKNARQRTIYRLKGSLS